MTIQKRIILPVVMALFLGAWPATAQEAADMPPIGETRIPFYSGNLSVGFFRQYWGLGPMPGQEEVTPEMIALLKRTSCFAMSDYPAWCLLEQEQGAWDWTIFRQNEDALHAAGIQYNMFAWLHFPPKWFEESKDFVPYANLETGETIPQISLWSPFCRTIYVEYYKRLATEFGKKVDFIRLAMPSEYGEIGYCAGMTSWLRPQEHAQPAFWCGDPCAKDDFRRTMLALYHTLENLNAVWGTVFAATPEIEMPPVRGTGIGDGIDLNNLQHRRRWLDFVNWYQDSWTHFAEWAIDEVRRHFPEEDPILSIGYGAEPVYAGNDEARHIKMMAKKQVPCQSPGDIGYFPARRNSSACRFYGVDYFTEPPGNVPRERQLSRIWMDASNGTQTWFDYPGNLDGARDLFVRYKAWLDGSPPLCDFAVILPTTHLWLHPEWGWPPETIQGADAIRDLLDYEVIDERMIEDGALMKMGIKTAVLFEAEVMDKAAIQSLRQWINSGGVLFIRENAVPQTIEGSTQEFQSLLPKKKIPAEICATKESPIDFPSSLVIDIGSAEDEHFLTGQWNEREPREAGRPPFDLRWSSKGAGLLIPARKGARYTLEISGTLRDFLRPARVLVNGATVGQLEWNQPQPRTSPVAVTADETGFIQISIDAEIWTAREKGLGNDTRPLGIYLDWIRLTEEGAKPVEEIKTNITPPQRRFNEDCLIRESSGKIGRGMVVVLPGGTEWKTGQIQAIAGIHFNLSKYGGVNGRRMDGVEDGVLTTLFKKHILLFNPSGEKRTTKVTFRKTDFDRDARPEKLEYVLDFDPRQIRAIELK